MKQLMRHIGNPHQRLKVIHIAGTSGKTSTCYMIRHLLEQAGQKTGLTVSPHITTVTERFQIDGRPIDEQVFLRYCNEFRDLIEDYGAEVSYSALAIALAYWIFCREQVDYAVIESVVGGLYDSTNVADAIDKVCVITAIGTDHVEILGDTIESIARHKAGIIQPGNRAFLIAQKDTIEHEITHYAMRQRSELSIVPVVPDDSLPQMQWGNWSLAQTVYRYISLRDNLPGIAAEQYSSGALPPARCETYQINGRTIILDGAHNPQELSALVGTLREGGIRRATVITAMKAGDDSKVTHSCRELSLLGGDIIVSSFTLGSGNKRILSAAPERLKKLFESYGSTRVSIALSHEQALAQALVSDTTHIVITGSLYLAAQMRPLLVHPTG